MKCASDPRWQCRGATLTELMVAFAVAAVLLALVAMAVRHVGAVSDRARCVSNLRQGAAGLISFTVDNRGALPAANAWYNRGNDATAPGMREYMNVSANTDETRIDTIWTCPALQRDPATRASPDSAFRRTYSLNLCATTGHRQYSLNNVYKIQYPARMVTFFDGSIQTRRRNANAYHIGHGYRHYPERLTQPHGKRLNVAFLDGHVENMSIAELLDPLGLESRWEGK